MRFNSYTRAAVLNGVTEIQQGINKVREDIGPKCERFGATVPPQQRRTKIVTTTYVSIKYLCRLRVNIMATAWF